MVSILKEAPRIKSATTVFTKDNIRKQIASEIAALMPMIKGSQEEKLRQSKRMIARLLAVKYNDIDNPNLRVGTRNFLLRQSTEIIDKPSQSWTKAPQTQRDDSSKTITPPDQSTYQNRTQCLSAYLDAGYSTAAGLEACNKIYGPTPGTVGGTTTRNMNHGMGGGKSTVTTSTPQAGRIAVKSASREEIPSYVVLSGLEKEYSEYMANAPTNTKSANISTVTPEYFGVGSSIAEILSQSRRNKEEAREARYNASRLKSASTIPAWARCMNIFNEYTGMS